jgi:hypothetical protein
MTKVAFSNAFCPFENGADFASKATLENLSLWGMSSDLQHRLKNKYVKQGIELLTSK